MKYYQVIDEETKKAAKEYADIHNIIGGYRGLEFIAGAQWMRDYLIIEIAKWFADRYDEKGSLDPNDIIDLVAEFDYDRTTKKSN